MSRPTLPTVPLPIREIVILTMAFERNRLFAKEQASKGRRESARWWGEQARHDWNRLKDCLLTA
jgi:hypothetical protein